MRATLASRVAGAAALTVPLSGLLVVLVAWALTRVAARESEDARLRDAAAVLARELEAPDADPRAIAVDEADELVHTGMRVAISESGTLLAGDEALGLVDGGRCEDRGALRVCAVQVRGWVAMIGRDRSRVEERDELVLGAGLVAVLLTTMFGGLLAWAIGRRLTAPLTRLHAAVTAVDPEAPSGESLGADEGVAEIDALRHAVSQSYARVGEALARERRFARDAAHELRTPLTVLMGELELVAEALDGEDRAAVLRARRVAGRLGVLVERLLLLSRTGEGVVREPIELRDLAEDLRDELPDAARARVAIEGSAEVEGDGALLGALVSNGLENALKFSTGAVRVELAREGGEARVSILDDGPGVDDADREQVFAPFFRSRGVRAGGAHGHGIGLALVAHAARLHGGRARFLDVPRGAALEIRIPADPLDVEHRAEAGPRTPVSAVDPARSSSRRVGAARG